MKKHTRLSSFTTLATVAVSSFIIFAFIQTPFSPPQENTLTLNEAITLHKNYDNSTSSVQSRIEGIYLSGEVLAEISGILASKPDAAGVRIYFGKDATGKTKNILVTTNREGKDDTSFLLKTSGATTICPNICDAESAIMKQ